MKIEQEILLDYKDVLFKPEPGRVASRKDVNLTVEYSFKHCPHTYKGVAIIGANMDGVGTFEMAKIMTFSGMSVALRKNYSTNEFLEFYNNNLLAEDNWFTIGMGDDDLDRLQTIKAGRKGFHRICIDVANGYNESFVDRVRTVRKLYPDALIMAGNVVTGDQTRYLLGAGADIVKVGIGPGSVCTTRKMTGVGYPQLSAVIKCAQAARSVGGRICADGGCQVPGDIAKAFGGGADFVMVGGMLSGFTEGEYDTEYDEDGKPYYAFYGMSSDTAQKRYEGSMRQYRASEGKTVRITPRGNVGPALAEIMGGIRSTCTYLGINHLSKIYDHTTFVRVTQQLNPHFS